MWNPAVPWNGAVAIHSPVLMAERRSASVHSTPQCSHAYCASSGCSGGHFTFAHLSTCFSPQWGQVRKKKRLSLCSKASSMREPVPFAWSARTVGVEHRRRFLFQKAVARFHARFTGSPSAPADTGYRSTSSQRTTRTGRDASEEGLFAPQTVRCPPGNFLCRMVLSLKRLFTSLTRPCKAGVSRNIGARRSLDHACPMSRVGCTTSIGEGSWSMKYPTMLFTISVLCVGTKWRPARYRWLGLSTCMHRTGTEGTRYTAVTRRRNVSDARRPSRGRRRDCLRSSRNRLESA